MVYDEAAILPFAVVTYEFEKLGAAVAQVDVSEEESGAKNTSGGGSNDKDKPIETLADLIVKSEVDLEVLLSYSTEDLRELMKVSFQWKNLDFLFKNPDFLLNNPDFLLKNVDFMIKQGPGRNGRASECDFGRGQGGQAAGRRSGPDADNV